MSAVFHGVRSFGLLVVLSVFSPISLSAAMAGAAPSQLLDKSIDITWGENSSNKRVADGAVVTAATRFQRLVYISSKGRPFIRASGGSGAVSRSADIDPEIAKTGTDFRGNVLVLAGNTMSVGRQITVNFDAGFSGCTASVRVGKNGASPKWIGFDGAPYELLSISVNSVSCSVREGNAVGRN